MTVHRIKAMLADMRGGSPNDPRAQAPHLLAELTNEVGSLLENLDARIQHLSAAIESAELGPQAVTVERAMRDLETDFANGTLAERITAPMSDADMLHRDDEPIIAWREMAEAVEQGQTPSGFPDWVPAAFGQVASILGGEGFPCIFARQANHLKSGWLCFVDSVETTDGRETVKRAILAYLGIINRYSRQRAIIMPLLVVVKPAYPTLSLKDYRDQAWGLFQHLHDNDPGQWPVEVPADPDRGDWSFCFNGIQLFSNVSDPAHRTHISRNLGDSLAFAMQPRTNFDLVGGNNKKGRQVRAEIRARAERYEGRPIASHLGFFGTPDNREWMQMATKDSEDDVDFPKVCPFRFNHAKHGKPGAE